MSTENDEIINSLIRQINNFDKALQHAAARSDITLLAISFLASVMDKMKSYDRVLLIISTRFNPALSIMRASIMRKSMLSL